MNEYVRAAHRSILVSLRLGGLIFAVASAAALLPVTAIQLMRPESSADETGAVVGIPAMVVAVLLIVLSMLTTPGVEEAASRTTYFWHEKLRSYAAALFVVAVLSAGPYWLIGVSWATKLALVLAAASLAVVLADIAWRMITNRAQR